MIDFSDQYTKFVKLMKLEYDVKFILCVKMVMRNADKNIHKSFEGLEGVQNIKLIHGNEYLLHKYVITLYIKRSLK